METQDLLGPKEIKSNVPRWVIAWCATLMFLSVFINSIGFNLMSVNEALTQHVVAAIESKTKVVPDNNKVFERIIERIIKLEEEIELLKIDSHPPKNKGD